MTLLGETTEQFVPRQKLIGTPRAINQAHTLSRAFGTGSVASEGLCSSILRRGLFSSQL